ncbi:hypothetical protein ACFX19_043957 [Malus domestica]
MHEDEGVEESQPSGLRQLLAAAVDLNEVPKDGALIGVTDLEGSGNHDNVGLPDLNEIANPEAMMIWQSYHFLTRKQSKVVLK